MNEFIFALSCPVRFCGGCVLFNFNFDVCLLYVFIISWSFWSRWRCFFPAFWFTILFVSLSVFPLVTRVWLSISWCTDDLYSLGDLCLRFLPLSQNDQYLVTGPKSDHKSSIEFQILNPPAFDPSDKTKQTFKKTWESPIQLAAFQRDNIIHPNWHSLVDIVHFVPLHSYSFIVSAIPLSFNPISKRHKWWKSNRIR